MRRILVAALAAIAMPALAAPDLTGFWSQSNAKTSDKALVAKLPAGTTLIDDTGFVEFPQGVFGGLKVNADALAAAAKWKPEDEMALNRVCAKQSIVYSIQGPFPFEIYQTPQLIVFKYEYFDMVRLIWMDGRKHPGPEVPHSTVGFSTGRWDGDELVVDTTHLSRATITNNGLEHSDQAHQIERYKLSPDRKTLRATQWFEDPETLNGPGARYIEWTLKPGEHVYPYDCDPSFSTNYEKATK